MVCCGDSLPGVALAMGEPEPAMQTGLGDPEITGDLSARSIRLQGDRDYALAEIQRKRLRNEQYPSSEDETSQVR